MHILATSDAENLNKRIERIFIILPMLPQFGHLNLNLNKRIESEAEERALDVDGLLNLNKRIEST